MSLDQIFELANGFAFISWIFLIIASYWAWTPKIIIGITITGLSILYSYFIFIGLNVEDLSNFQTLDGIVSLFSNKAAVLPGWIHYLAFDLLAGVFIITNAKKNNINRWVIIPCLIFSFMLGPMGFLLYLIIRGIKTRTYFPNFG